eukprot:bmy_13212T0
MFFKPPDGGAHGEVGEAKRGLRPSPAGRQVRPTSPTKVQRRLCPRLRKGVRLAGPQLLGPWETGPQPTSSCLLGFSQARSSSDGRSPSVTRDQGGQDAARGPAQPPRLATRQQRAAWPQAQPGPRNKGRSVTAQHLQFCTEPALLRPGARKQPVKWASQQTPKPDLFPGPDPRTKVPEGSRRSLSPFPPPTSPH